MRFLTIPLTTLCVMILVSNGNAQSEWPVEKQQAVDQAVRVQMEQQGLVGVSIGFLENNQIVYLKSYGFENREDQVEASSNTLYRWASISKPITAIAAFQLIEQGKLNLDDDVRKHVPEFPDKGVKITVRDLLCHQSGIVHYRNGRVVRTRREYEQENPFEDVVLALDTFKESPLVHPPGEKYSYSTHAYILLSAVVEKAGGQKFAEQIQTRIATPLGMTTLRPDYQWEDIPNRAVGYRKRGSNQTPTVSSNTDVSWKLGGGGFISNVDDLAKFAEGLLNKKLISASSHDEMWTRQSLANGKETGVGLGLFVDGSGATLKISHNGAQEKTRTRMAIYPNKGTGVVVMTNSEYADVGRITTAIYGAIRKVNSR